MVRNQEYRFVCDADMARRMDRIVTLAGGVILAQETSSEDVVIRVMKAA
jgi:hypothetical protein